MAIEDDVVSATCHRVIDAATQHARASHPRKRRDIATRGRRVDMKLTVGALTRQVYEVYI